MSQLPNGNDHLDGNVEPIRSLEAIRAIKRLLAPKPRDLLLFTLGINNGLRAGDLLRVTLGEVRNAKPGELLWIREKQSGARVPLVLQPESCSALRRHLEQLCPPPPPENMYLFADQQGWTPLKTQRMDEMVREWTRHVGLTGQFGAHTLRKTFGYLQRTRYGVGFEILARRFNHPSAAVTMRYLGFSADEELDLTLPEL